MSADGGDGADGADRPDGASDATGMMARAAPARTERPERSYEHLRADPERRRAAYGLLVLLGVAVFGLSLLDMLVLDGALYLGILAGYGVLLAVGLVLLFSRREDGFEGRGPDAQPLVAHDLRCPHCGTVFRASAEGGLRAGAAAFSCPGCGVFSRLPPPGAERVSASVPSGAHRTTLHLCDNCGERVVVETFGAEAHRVRFRACPRCSQRHTLRVRGSTTGGTVRGGPALTPGPAGAASTATGPNRAAGTDGGPRA